MTPIQKITIPQPCHQDWQLMTPVEQGRHCRQCNKTVTDFTGMNNAQIIDYFSSYSNVCGRFAQNQLGNINNQLDYENAKNNIGWKKWLAAMVFWGSTMFFEANSQSAAALPKLFEQEINPFDTGRTIGKIAVHNSVKTKVIKGHVVDETKQPVSGAIIKIPSTGISTVTDASGKFEFNVPLTAKGFSVGFIGYDTQLISITSGSAPVCEVKLKLQPGLSGEVVIVSRPPLIKRLYYKYIKRPIHRIFN